MSRIPPEQNSHESHTTQDKSESQEKKGKDEPFSDKTIIGYGGKGRFATDNENAKNAAIELQPSKWFEIKDLIDYPQENIDKLKAWWIIFNDSKSRLIKNVDKDTRYYCLWADIDRGNIPTVEAIRNEIALFTSECDCEVYSSNSATSDLMKARVVIPLKIPLCVEDWAACQILLNNYLESSGIEFDPVNKNPVQICFLPNKGAFYETANYRNNDFFNPLSKYKDEIDKLKEKIKSGGSRDNNREYNFGGSGLTHKEIINILCKGLDGYHQAQNCYSWGRIRENATRGAVIGELETFADLWKEDSTRWNDRYNDIERCVDGAIVRLKSDEKVDISDIKDREIVKRKIPMPPGLLGKLCENAKEMSWHPYDETALASALGLVAGIAGRKFNVSRTGLNIYVTLVANTAMGKDSMGKFINNTLASLNPTGSGSSFIGLSDITGPKPLARSLLIARNQICVFEEAGLMMASQTGAQAELQKFILAIYTSSGLRNFLGGKGYSDPKDNMPLLRSPSLSVISESTPDSMFSALKGVGALTNGHMPRQTILRITGKKPFRNKNPKKAIDKDLYDRLLILCNKCSEVQCKDKLEENDVFNFVFDGDLKDEEYAFSCECVNLEDEFKNTPKGLMASRAPVKAMKYAALAMVINYEHELTMQRPEWEWGLALARYELDSVDDFFAGSNLDNATHNLIKTILAECIRNLLNDKVNDVQTALTKYELREGYIPESKILRLTSKRGKLHYDTRIDHTKCVKNLLNIMVDFEYLTRISACVDRFGKTYKGTVYRVTSGFKTLFDNHREKKG